MTPYHPIGHPDEEFDIDTLNKPNKPWEHWAMQRELELRRRLTDEGYDWLEWKTKQEGSKT